MSKLLMTLPFFVSDLLYISVLIFASTQFIGKLHVVEPYYSKTILTCYYLSMWMLTLVRILDSIDEAFSFTVSFILSEAMGLIPVTFMIIITAIFLDYLLCLLYNRFVSPSKTKYSNYRIYLKLFLVYVLVTGISLSFITPYLDNIYGGHTFEKIKFYNTGLCTLMLGFFLIYVILTYENELKTYPVTFKNSKNIMTFVIFAMSSEIVVKIANSILYIENFSLYLNEITNEQQIPYRSLYYSNYFLLSDILPLIAYTLYFKHDFFQLGIIDREQDVIDNNDSSMCAASIIEDRLGQYLIMTNYRNSINSHNYLY